MDKQSIVQGAPNGAFAGVALAAPFYADLLGWKIAALLILPWLIITVIRPREFRISLGILLLTLVLVAHIAALIFTSTPFEKTVLRDIAASSLLVAVAASAVGKPPRDIGRGFFVAVVAAAAVAAVIGLIKLGLQDRGYLLGFIVRACPGQYPQGSNLCTDYNLLGLLWLTASAGVIGFRVRKRSVAALALLSILVAAGLTVGSRRFLLLLPILLALWVWMTVSTGGVRKLKFEAAAIVGALVLSFAIVSVVTAPETYERYRFGEEPMTILWETQGSATPPNRAYPAVIAKTIETDGLTSRLDRWLLGLEMLAQSPLYGYGFNYQSIFSNAFVGGSFIDHPHMPLISEGLIGGVGLLLIAAALYAWLLRSVTSSSRELTLSGIPCAFVLVSGVASISGDTLLSIHQWPAAALLLIAASGEARVPLLRRAKGASRGASRD